MFRRPPETSFGYRAPRNAQIVGWRCPHRGCGRAEGEIPRRWPHFCDNCLRPVDPEFAEPWAHHAKGYEWRHVIANPEDEYMYRLAMVELSVWQFEDALRNRDRAAADWARENLMSVAAKLRPQGKDSYVSTGHLKIIYCALRHGELDLAAHQVLAFHEHVRTITPADLEDNQPRTDARVFVDGCIAFMCDRRSIGHPREPHVGNLMQVVGDMLCDHGYSTSNLDDGRHRAMRIRAIDRGTAPPSAPEWLPPTEVLAPAASQHLPADVRRRLEAASDAVARAKTGNMPEPLADVLVEMADLASARNGADVSARAAVVLAEAVLTIAEIHDDPAPLLAAAERLDTAPALAHLLRARAHVVVGDVSSAMREIDAAMSTSDCARLGLLPHLHAMRGWMIVQLDPDRLDDGIVACRTGREVARARKTPADLPLARLLVEKALNRITPVHEAVALLNEALALCKRLGEDAEVVQQEAKSALAVLTGRGDTQKQLRAWRAAVRNTVRAPVTVQMRLAMAWVRWALGTARAELAAEAYLHVVSLLPVMVRVRYRADAQERLLVAVREHTEEAGYWLARARRYRDAAVVLEIGRAVVLSTVIERDDPTMARALVDAGRADLLKRYQSALAATKASDSHGAWARFKAVAREIADAIGTDSLEPEVQYADITRATTDGAVVYVASAEASGYALVVAAQHDPQCVWLPGLSRLGVEAWLDEQPDDFKDRARGLGEDLEWLWNKGIRELLAYFAQGSVITLIPVGVMTLLPLHAAPGHANLFTRLRYAPNARTLLWCRDRAESFAAHPPRVLAADVPQAPGEEELPNAAEETAIVAATWPGRCLRLTGATWARFEQVANDYDVWHITCHGRLDEREVLRSSLAFADRTVTVDDLRNRFHFARRRLAIVSSCDMHNVGAEMPNEAIGLPSALLQLGFAGVIAASWPVGDLATAYLMARFHQLWRDTGAHPAVALAAAQSWLKNARTEELLAVAPTLEPPDAEYGLRPFSRPSSWAAFAYTGG